MAVEAKERERSCGQDEEGRDTGYRVDRPSAVTGMVTTQELVALSSSGTVSSKTEGWAVEGRLGRGGEGKGGEEREGEGRGGGWEDVFLTVLITY